VSLIVGRIGEEGYHSLKEALSPMNCCNQREEEDGSQDEETSSRIVLNSYFQEEEEDEESIEELNEDRLMTWGEVLLKLICPSYSFSSSDIDLRVERDQMWAQPFQLPPSTLPNQAEEDDDNNLEESEMWKGMGVKVI